MTISLTPTKQQQRPSAAAATRPAAASRRALVVSANKRVAKRRQVILTEDSPNLGAKAGEQRAVALGYWRNCLQPRRLAKAASANALEAIRAAKEAAVRAKLEEKAQAQAFANALATIGKFAIKKPAGERDALFAAVTKEEVCDAVYQQTGRDVKSLPMEVPEIKALGTYEVSVRLHPEVVGRFSVLVQKGKTAPPAKK
jgi:large subunit ribosomal protein L9